MLSSKYQNYTTKLDTCSNTTPQYLHTSNILITSNSILLGGAR